MSDFIESIRNRVRVSLLSYVAESTGWTTSNLDFRAGMILTPEAQAERDDFEAIYGIDGGCYCFISPPCGYCTHPGNPSNQEEGDDCWIPAVKGCNS